MPKSWDEVRAELEAQRQRKWRIKHHIESVAKERHESGRYSKTNTPLYDYAEEVGIAGEIAFANRYLKDPDYEAKSEKTPGYQFVVNGKTIKVQTSEVARNVLVKKGGVKADIYVLAKVKKKCYDPDEVKFRGWTTGKEVRKRKPKAWTFGHGYDQDAHGVPLKDLEDMRELREYLELDAPKIPADQAVLF